MKFYIGNTDFGWYNFLREINPEDINFWQPGGVAHFRAIESGAPFLLRLKNPIDKVAGIGFFTSESILPIEYAWEVFGIRNGTGCFSEFYSKIKKYRERNRNISNSLENNSNIGCIVLTNPIFFNEEDWLSSPENWTKNIVQGKTYSTDEKNGENYWERVKYILEKHSIFCNNEKAAEVNPGYKSILSKVRIGQGAFRVMVTDAYARRCAISGEKTLPVLEAAHIKPYSYGGINKTDNGLLLRSDLHKLFDAGYITINADNYYVEVSKKIKEEFENGRDYYKYHGQHLKSLPDNKNDLPNQNFLHWHNTEKYEKKFGLI